MPEETKPTSSVEPTGLPSGEPVAPTGEGDGKQPAQKPLESLVPPAKTYSEEEWRGRQSATDKQIAEVGKQHKAELAAMKAQIKQFEVQARQSEYTKLLAKVEEAGDADLATLTKHIVAQAQSLAQKEAEKEAEWATRNEEWEAKQQVLKFAAAVELMSKYGLAPEVREELLKADSAEAMEIQAARMKIAKLESVQQPPDVVDQGAGLTGVQDVNKLSAKELIREGIKELKNRNR